MASATIDLGLNAAPFEQGLATAERSAKGFQGRLQSLFRRDPNHRTGAALGSFLGDVSAGNIQNAVVGLTGRMRGLGLGLTVAATAGIALYEGIKKAREEGEALTASITRSNQSSGPAGLNTVEGLTSKLAAIREQREAMVKHEKEYGYTNAAADSGFQLSDFLKDPRLVAAKLLSNYGKAQSDRDKQTAASFAAEKTTLADIATKARTVADIEDMRLHTSKRRAALMESEAKFQEKYGPLIQAGPSQNPEAAAQLKRLHQLDIEGINRDTGPAAIISPKRLVASTGAYLRHPDAYDTGATRTDNDKMISARRSGLDWFKDHPRDFGFNAPRTFLKSDESSYYKDVGVAKASVSAGASMTGDPSLTGIEAAILSPMITAVLSLGSPKVLDKILGALGLQGANK